MTAKLSMNDALHELWRRGYTIYRWGSDPNNPEIFAAVWRWREHKCADVLIFRSEKDATGFRVLLETALADPFKPEVIVHFYQAHATWTMWDMLSLVPPGCIKSPHDRMSAKDACFIPAEFEHVKASIRPPRNRGKSK